MLLIPEDLQNIIYLKSKQMDSKILKDEIEVTFHEFKSLKLIGVAISSQTPLKLFQTTFSKSVLDC